MSRLLPHVLPRRFWMCSCCASLHVTIPNTFWDGDPNHHRHKCSSCMHKHEHGADTTHGPMEDVHWDEVDEAFVLLELNVSDEGFREAKEMVAGVLAFRSNQQHQREVPHYALKVELPKPPTERRARERFLGFIREEGCTCLCRDDATRDLSLGCPVHK